MESMACGTPVVAFNIGGNPDMIQHQRNGYLARHLDADDLGEGIRWVIDHKDYEKLAINARNTITERFDIARVAGQYAALYRKVLGKDS
jgi:glycosyltransferase involved in cell wall biosynthesis